MHYRLMLIMIAFLLHSCEEGNNEPKPESCPENAVYTEQGCECKDGFIGPDCGEIYDKCLARKTDCGEGGKCVEGFCECEDNYQGSACEVHVPTDIQGKFTVIDFSSRPDNLAHKDPGFTELIITDEQPRDLFEAFMENLYYSSHEYIYNTDFSGNDALREKFGMMLKYPGEDHWRLTSIWYFCYLSSKAFDYTLKYKNDTIYGSGLLCDYYDANRAVDRGGPRCTKRNEVRATFIAVRTSELDMNQR